MKIFLIGRFRQFEETKQKFQPWADELRKIGHEVINPLEILTGEKNWFESTSQCIKLLMDCHAIFLLNDWNTSSIGKLSFYVAMNLRYDIFMEHDINFLRLMAKLGVIDLDINKINKAAVRSWVDGKIEKCKNGIFITDAMNDTIKKVHWEEDLKNFEMIRDVICRPSEISHAEN